MAKKREGLQLIPGLPQDCEILNMIPFEDALFVATDHGVYRLTADHFEKVEFDNKDERERPLLRRIK